MSKPKVEIINLDRFKKKLRAMQDTMRSEVLHDAAEAGGRVVETYAKINIERTFSKRSTGGLAGSMMVEVEASATKAEAKIGPSAVYGRIQELGGVIRPLVKRMLHWIDPETGEERWAKMVHIPARPYLRPALDEHKPEILKAVMETIKYGIRRATDGQ